MVTEAQEETRSYSIIAGAETWFTRILGYKTEDEFLQQLKLNGNEIIRKDKDGNLYVRHASNLDSWLNAGQFTVLSLEQLEAINNSNNELVESEDDAQDDECVYEIHVRQDEKSLPFVDISALQAVDYG